MAVNGRDTRTHAQKRRAEAQAALRDKFKGIQYISEIESDYAELTAIDFELRTAPDIGALALRNAKADARLKVIKLKLDTNFRRLAKVLPDLKQIELANEVNEDDVTPVQVIIQAVDASVKRP